MKLVFNIQLLPTHEQVVALYAMLERYNATCAWPSERAWATKMFQQCRGEPREGRAAQAQPAEDNRCADYAHEERL